MTLTESPLNDTLIAQNRGAQFSEAKLVLDGLEIDTGRYEVTVAGRGVNLTKSEFNILLVLARKPGYVYSRAQIYGQIRGANHAFSRRSVDVMVLSLRRKLGEVYAARIETVRGFGYRLAD